MINGLTRDSILMGCVDRGTLNPPGTATYTNYVSAAGTKRTTAALGQVFDLGSGVTITCVAKNAKTISGDSVAPGAVGDQNKNSLGLLLVYGSFRMMFATDMPSTVENILAPDVGRVTAVQVNHHGSATSTSATWAQTLHPRLSFISCGPGNGYGHPTQTAINNLQAVDSNYIYQTEPGDAGCGTITAGRGVITNSNIWIIVGASSYAVHYAGKDTILPLAVELSQFTAQQRAGGIELSWRTESETDCYQWQIERSNAEDAGYQPVGTIMGYGTTDQPHNYRYTDNMLTLAGRCYYRLAEIDLSGKKTYHDLINVMYNSQGILSFQAGPVYPNPARDNANLSCQLPVPGAVSVVIYNIAGQRVKSLVNSNYPAGSMNATWDGRDQLGQNQPNGVYLFRLVFDGATSADQRQSLVRKFVLTR